MFFNINKDLGFTVSNNKEYVNIRNLLNKQVKIMSWTNLAKIRKYKG